MFALNRTERGFLAALALASLAGAVVTSPTVARSAAVLPAAEAIASPIARATNVALVSPHRDPFAGGEPEPQPAPTFAPPLAVIPAIPPIPGAMRALPPNAGALGTPPATTVPRITAVVAGRHPFALAEENGTSRLLTVGDAFGASTVVAVRDDGIALADGSHVALDPAPPLHGGY